MRGVWGASARVRVLAGHTRPGHGARPGCRARPGHVVARRSCPPGSPTPSTEADEVIKLAHEEARAKLREQDATLRSVRNRTTALLAAAAVGTSIAGAAVVALVNSDSEGAHGISSWAGWSLLSLAAVFGAGLVMVLWPTPPWLVDPGPAQLLESAGEDIDLVLRAATQTMIEALTSNDQVLRRHRAAYRLTVGLALELVVLVLVLILSRG